MVSLLYTLSVFFLLCVQRLALKRLQEVGMGVMAPLDLTSHPACIPFLLCFCLAGFAEASAEAVARGGGGSDGPSGSSCSSRPFPPPLPCSPSTKLLPGHTRACHQESIAQLLQLPHLYQYCVCSLRHGSSCKLCTVYTITYCALMCVRYTVPVYYRACCYVYCLSTARWP